MSQTYIWSFWRILGFSNGPKPKFQIFFSKKHGVQIIYYSTYKHLLTVACQVSIFVLFAQHFQKTLNYFKILLWENQHSDTFFWNPLQIFFEKQRLSSEGEREHQTRTRTPNTDSSTKRGREHQTQTRTPNAKREHRTRNAYTNASKKKQEERESQARGTRISKNWIYHFNHR